MPRLKGEIVKSELNNIVLNDKQKLFVMEYLIDVDATRAAKAVGYRGASAGPKLLANPQVAKVLKRITDRMAIKAELSKERVLQELSYCAFRDAGELVDDTGTVKGNIKELPEHIRRAIDGIKQKVRVYYDDEGNETHRDIETELKLVPKAQAIDMTMKHFGAYAAQQVQGEVLIKVDWDRLVAPPKIARNVLTMDQIEDSISLPTLGDDSLDHYGEAEDGDED